MQVVIDPHLDGLQVTGIYGTKKTVPNLWLIKIRGAFPTHVTARLGPHRSPQVGIFFFQKNNICWQGRNNDLTGPFKEL